MRRILFCALPALALTLLLALPDVTFAQRRGGGFSSGFAESQQEMERDYWKRRQAESRYRMLFQVATDAVIVVDALTMSIVEANRAAAQLFGIAQAELVGKHATVGMDRHSWPAVEELLTSTRTTGRAAEIRARLPEGGGTIDVSATPFRSDRDLLLLVRARVPTHRRLVAQPDAHAQAADAQADPQAQWADLVRRIPDAVVITDSSGRVLMANPAFVELCQLGDATQGEGRELGAWIGTDAAAGLIAQVKLHGIATRAAAVLRGESARAIGVGISAALLDDGDSEYIGFTIRRLEAGAQAALPAVEDVAVAIEALASLMGRQPLPELLRAATALTERHLIRTALQRSLGDAHAASVLLGVTPQMLAERLVLHDIAPGGDGASQNQLN
jgi:transcriptional regulator PpsR